MKYYVVDAFAEKVFEGNPAGVCIMEEWLSDDTMQKIATENNLSETAFAVKEGESYRLRWFTPADEIELCGHATLATAYVIANYYENNVEEIKFQTMSGELVVLKKDELYEMDFPSRMPEEFPLTDQIVEALGVKPIETYLGRDLMLVLEKEEDVQNASPDFSKLEKLPDGLGVSITAKSNKYDFVSRSFFPNLKVNEDPVCGSAHCNFIPYWAKRLGKNEMVARQLSKRGGTLYCKSSGDRVKISGSAVLYAIADLQIR
ncbi:MULTISPECIES: PhzF family phenazine biosynthesis protein [unclassified Peribacillus]|uniref:PhzF family phenazine biosynthesis protein n=1 Tax=unclassified Peribacillus TaxID=2675266 RepID=UPI001913C3DC|nr:MULTISPECIES: PhzF family phenazine biosynthesis protein [unclassified Peribacillus]MBK5445233.1 PhzF family phenazine biosynthesis protein [Peribacillus sp. TH24]MBK5460042.1 PhzF family phenazine biosynthesis protein [Peribacillus sp. TH27]MBK5481856.1 PhzF family phenazine biosynthesis protein [Peribacillus sp. TH16]MBK5498233.1 PhzF family phenazine biosynthesis protein [Peribacillus sp. TH14]WMX56650.1 PhzF family phenazine biosynthesis protein [Peribacillus sp. R9-11]